MNAADLKRTIRSSVLVRARSGQTIIGADQMPAAWLFDFRTLLLQPVWLDRYAEIFWERYASQYPFQVCGMESAAISLISAIVMKSVERGTPANGFYIRKSRKKEGLMKIIEGMPTDDPIILVDDIINSGKTFDKQIKILEQEQKKVAGIFTLLAFRAPDAYRFATDKKIDVSSLFTLEDFDIPLLSSKSPEVPADTFNIEWRFQASDPSLQHVIQKSAPTLDDARVYFGSDAGIFYALDQSTGDVMWQHEIGKHLAGKGIFSSPALHGGSVYFGAYDGNVYALEAATGKKIWSYGDADWIGSSPTLAPELDSLFIGLEFGLFKKRGGIACLSMRTGTLRWQHKTSEHTHGSPIYIPEHSLVVVGSNDGIVYAHDAKTGEVRWQYKTGGHIKSTPAYDEKRGYVIVGSMDGNTYILHAGTGIAMHVHATGAGIYSIPLIVGNIAFVASLDKYLYAIDLDTFKERWIFETRGRIFASPIIADGSLWIGSNDGCLYELNPHTGAVHGVQQFTERIVNKITYNPTTKRFFVPTHANELYCLRRTREK